MPDGCIYCSVPLTKSGTREHVLPDFLGCPLRLPPSAVCAMCNQTFNRELHLPLRNYLLPILAKLGIRTSKTGMLPSIVRNLRVAGEMVQLRISARNLERARPFVRKLQNGDYEVISRTKEEGERIFRQILKKYPSMIVKSSSYYQNPPPEDETFEHSIKKEIFFRCMSQFALNCIAFWFGSEVARSPEFDEVRSHAMGHPSPLAVSAATKSGQDLSEILPVLICSFLPDRPGSVVRVNLFDTVVGKVPTSWGGSQPNRYFIIDSKERRVLGDRLSSEQ